MNETMLVALVFVVLLGVEWRYRLKSVRVAVAVLALIVSFFYQSSATRAARRAIVMQPSQRVTHPSGTEYASGVATMYQAVADDSEMSGSERLLSMGVLFWLACSPVLPRRSSGRFEPAVGEAAV